MQINSLPRPPIIVHNCLLRMCSLQWNDMGTAGATGGADGASSTPHGKMTGNKGQGRDFWTKAVNFWNGGLPQTQRVSFGQGGQPGTGTPQDTGGGGGGGIVYNNVGPTAGSGTDERTSGPPTRGVGGKGFGAGGGAGGYGPTAFYHFQNGGAGANGVVLVKYCAPGHYLSAGLLCRRCPYGAKDPAAVSVDDEATTCAKSTTTTTTTTTTTATTTTMQVQKYESSGKFKFKGSVMVLAIGGGSGGHIKYGGASGAINFGKQTLGSTDNVVTVGTGGTGYHNSGTYAMKDGYHNDYHTKDDKYATAGSDSTFGGLKAPGAKAADWSKTALGGSAGGSGGYVQ